MNKELLEKLIKLNNTNTCPEFTYNNPLLERKVANAVAKSFVKMFSISQQETNIKINLRHSVLANIRKICKTGPDNHKNIDDALTDSISVLYLKKLKAGQSQSTERTLNEFLLTNIKDTDLGSDLNYKVFSDPDVIQALINLNRNDGQLSSVLNDVLFWNSDKRNISLVKDIWRNSSFESDDSVTIGHIAIKNKAEIEMILLDICSSVLTDASIKIEQLFSDEKLIDIINKCSVSCECFQICYSILHSLLIHINYNPDILNLISHFIIMIKEKCSISALYPIHLKHIVILLDVELDYLPVNLKNVYIKQTLGHLKQLHRTSEVDFIILLSHYPAWFDIYYGNNL